MKVLISLNCATTQTRHSRLYDVYTQEGYRYHVSDRPRWRRLCLDFKHKLSSDISKSITFDFRINVLCWKYFICTSNLIAGASPGRLWSDSAQRIFSERTGLDVFHAYYRPNLRSHGDYFDKAVEREVISWPTTLKWNIDEEWDDARYMMSPEFGCGCERVCQLEWRWEAFSWRDRLRTGRMWVQQGDEVSPWSWPCVRYWTRPQDSPDAYMALYLHYSGASIGHAVTRFKYFITLNGSSGETFSFSGLAEELKEGVYHYCGSITKQMLYPWGSQFKERPLERNFKNLRSMEITIEPHASA